MSTKPVLLASMRGSFLIVRRKALENDHVIVGHFRCGGM